MLATAATTAKTPTYFNGGLDSIQRNEGLAYEHVQAILSNFYRLNQKIDSMEDEIVELRKNTDKDKAILQSRINEQNDELKVMKLEIRKLKSKATKNVTIPEQVLQDNSKCVAELLSAKKSIKHIERLVNTELNGKHAGSSPKKSPIQSHTEENFSQNKKNGSSFSKLTDVRNNQIETNINVSANEFRGTDNISFLRTATNGLFKREKDINKPFSKGKGVQSKRDITAEGIAFSAYLDHKILHMGNRSTIKCNQVLLNDGNHYNTFTGIFTVPETGVYLLTFSFGVEHKDDWTEVRLVVDNRDIVGAVGEVKGSSSRERKIASNMAIIKLSRGESVWLQTQRSDSEVISGPYYRWTTFSGVLLY